MTHKFVEYNDEPLTAQSRIYYTLYITAEKQ